MDTQHNDGGPAFPHNNWIERGSQRSRQFTDGMSLRDWFAGQLIFGWAAGRNNGADFGRSDPHLIANDCYRYADAMLAARKEKL